MNRAKERYKIRMEGKDNKSPYHSITRRDIARDVLRKYSNTDRYKGITEHLINLVISRIFQLKIEESFFKGYINIGSNLGKLLLIEYQGNKSNDFKKHGVNWDRTLDLWLDNPKAKENKTLVRFVEEQRKITYYWKRKGISNIRYYSFKISRNMQKRLNQMIKENKPILTLQP